MHVKCKPTIYRKKSPKFHPSSEIKPSQDAPEDGVRESMSEDNQKSPHSANVSLEDEKNPKTEPSYQTKDSDPQQETQKASSQMLATPSEIELVSSEVQIANNILLFVEFTFGNVQMKWCSVIEFDYLILISCKILLVYPSQILKKLILYNYFNEL